VTLRLVPNVVALPGSELADIETGALGFAHAIANGVLDLRLALIVTVDQDGIVDLVNIGEQALTDRAVGLLELAKHKLCTGAMR
jgi:hypothetical protein